MKAGLLALALVAALSAQAEPRVRHTAAPSNEPPCERLSGRLPNVSRSLCEAAQLRAVGVQRHQGDAAGQEEHQADLRTQVQPAHDLQGVAFGEKRHVLSP